MCSYMWVFTVVEPLKDGHQRGRSECPYYGGGRIVEGQITCISILVSLSRSGVHVMELSERRGLTELYNTYISV